MTMPLSEYADSLRHGRLPDTSYVFADVSHSTMAEEVEGLRELFGQAIGRQLPAHGIEDARKLIDSLPAAAFGGIAHLAMGGDGSGGGFHTHGDTLAVCLVGTKRWFIRRPGVPQATRRGAREFYRSINATASGRRRLSDGYWHCTQGAGDVVYVPPDLEHSVVNHGESLAVAMQFYTQFSLLHAAVANRHLTAIGALLDAGALIDARSSTGATPLHVCCMSGDTHTLKRLLDAGASVMAMDAAGGTPLHVAAQHGHAAAARALVRHGAPLDAVDGSGKGVTPLHVAAYYGHAEVARLLRRAGAKTDVREAGGRTAAEVAAWAGHGAGSEVTRALMGGARSRGSRRRREAGANAQAELHVEVDAGGSSVHDDDHGHRNSR